MTNRPLELIHIINPRPAHQAATWTNELTSLGATVTHFPAIDITPTPLTWLHSITPITQFDQIIFISANAVSYFLAGLTHPKEQLAGQSMVAIGKQTAKQLSQQAIDCDFPAVANSESLLNMSRFDTVDNQTILIVKGIGGRRLIAQSLKRRGAKVTQVNVYRRDCPKSPNLAANLWQNGKETIILGTSKQIIDNLFQMLTNHRPQLCQTTWLVMSHRVAEYAHRLGIKKTIVCASEQLIETLMQQQKGLSHD